MKIWIEMPFTHFALFIIFIEHQIFFNWKKNCFVPSWLWPCIAHPIYLVKKIKRMTQQLKREKYEYPSYNWVLSLPPLQVPEGTN